jgi:hypothetical protein
VYILHQGNKEGNWHDVCAQDRDAKLLLLKQVLQERNKDEAQDEQEGTQGQLKYQDKKQIKDHSSK